MKKFISLLIVVGILSITSLTAFAAGVTFYQDIYQSGPSTREIPVGTYSLGELQGYGFINDWASSCYITPGYRVKMWRDDGHRGTYWMLDQNDANSNDFTRFGANDEVSSIKVEKK